MRKGDNTFARFEFWLSVAKCRPPRFTLHGHPPIKDFKIERTFLALGITHSNSLESSSLFQIMSIKHILLVRGIDVSTGKSSDIRPIMSPLNWLFKFILWELKLILLAYWILDNIPLALFRQTFLFSCVIKVSGWCQDGNTSSCTITEVKQLELNLFSDGLHPSGELWVLLYIPWGLCHWFVTFPRGYMSNLGVVPTWLLSDTGNSAQ